MVYEQLSDGTSEEKKLKNKNTKVLLGLQVYTNYQDNIMSVITQMA